MDVLGGGKSIGNFFYELRTNNVNILNKYAVQQNAYCQLVDHIRGVCIHRGSAQP